MWIESIFDAIFKLTRGWQWYNNSLKSFNISTVDIVLITAVTLNNSQEFMKLPLLLQYSTTKYCTEQSLNAAVDAKVKVYFTLLN